jgi:hypothetical protein
MNGAKNPYRAGLGLDPPVLAGREQALGVIDEALEALARYEPAEPVVLTGLVGTGRTAVLRAASRRLAARKWAAGMVSVRRGRLGTAIGDAVAQAAMQIASRQPGAQALPRLRVEVERYCSVLAERPEAAETAVPRLFKAVGTAAMGSGWSLCLLLDDLHHATVEELVFLTEAASDAADQGWAVGIAGAALPSMEGRLAPGVVRLVELGPLDPPEVAVAVAEPVGGVGVGIDAAAIAAVGLLSGGFPLLLQAFAGQAWNEADGRPIAVLDVEAGRRHAEVELETWFFADALHDLVPSERRYLLAMAELGDGAVPAEAVARRIGDNGRPGGIGSRVADVRGKLEDMGLIHSADGVNLDFSLPLLGGYLRARG